ncbi:MAG: tetratricopeptide repeat protein, partial [Chlorobi bacterium]|nr:tetratricopeptide repeat protein [Chlorobiota bacterium]
MMKAMARIKWIVAFALAVMVNAQNSAVVTAWNYLQHEELDKAKEAIDKAIKHEQTKNKAKTWYYRAIIYGKISQSPKFKDLVPSPLDTALKSYEKTIELDNKGTYVEEIRQELYMLTQYLYNQGVQAYNDQDFKSAYEYFIKGNEVARLMAKAEGRTDFRGDTSFLEAAAISAYNAQMIDEAIKAYEGLLNAGKQTAKIYNTLAYLYMVGKQDIEGAEKVIKEGREKFPTDIDLIRKQINIYLMRNEIDKALPLIDEAIKKDSIDPMLYIIKGSIYEQQGNYDEAEKVYKKALALND